MFEREQLRCKLLEGRVEEIKLRRRTAAEAQAMSSIAPEPIVDPDLNPDDPDDFMQIISTDTEFRDVLNNFQETVKQVIKKRMELKFKMEPTSFEMDLPDDGSENFLT